MATLSKRTQARNERMLQDLILNVAGNDQCADCGARSPGWASWSLGIFLCMRCASLHRKLGTHISKVKSLSMDSWSTEQVEHMKRNGNVLVSEKYNPRGTKPAIPLDVDDADAVLERFIRQKYSPQGQMDGKTTPISRQDTNSSGQFEEQSFAPLPAKPQRRFFGLRSASSSIPRQRGRKDSDKELHIRQIQDERSSKANKQSRVFGATVGDSTDSLDAKMSELHGMGFVDEKRNLQVLKGFGGNMERSVDALSRLGEAVGSSPWQDKQISKIRIPSDHDQMRNFAAEAGTGSEGSAISPFRPELASTQNQNLSGASTAPPTRINSPQGPMSTDPNERLRMASLDQAFTGLHLSQQPLFPHATGGYPNHIPTFPEARFQSMTPPVFAPTEPFSPPISLGAPTQSGLFTRNPFLQGVQPHTNPSSAEHLESGIIPASAQYQTNQSCVATNVSSVYNGISSQQQSPLAAQGPFPMPAYQLPQSQQIHVNAQYPNTLQASYTTTNELPQPQTTPAYYEPYQPHNTNLTPIHSHPEQPPIFHDKNSILALYNQPHLAPPRPQADLAPPSNLTTSTTTTTDSIHQSVAAPVASPAIGRNNPFHRSTGPTSPSQLRQSQTTGNFVDRSISDNADIGTLHSGRHSPDVFANLSARFA